MMRIPCPACAFALAEENERFRCVKCSSVYGKSFIRRLQRQEFSALIDTHFGERVDILQEAESVVEEIAMVEPLETLLGGEQIEEIARPLSHVADDMAEMITPLRQYRLDPEKISRRPL